MKRSISQRTNVRKFRQPMKLMFATASCLLIGGFVGAGVGTCATVPIRLVPQQVSEIHTEGMPAKLQAAFAKRSANFHVFALASAGKPAKPESLTLQFAASTALTRIATTPDFKVLRGSTCEVGRRYRPAGTCQLIVRFTPKGAGPRLGRVVLENSAGKPVHIGLLGASYFPAISFTPSVMTTVAATVSSGTGLIDGARNLAVDNGDELYIADTGNSLIRYIDSSNVMRTIASGYTNPLGVTVNLFGEVYFSLPSANELYEIYDYGPIVQISGSGTDACLLGSSCALSSELVSAPGPMATSDGTTIFFTDRTQGAALAVVEPSPATLLRLRDDFPYQTDPQGGFAVDRNGNLYSSWTLDGHVCEIVYQPLYEAENLADYFVKVGGGRTCGFSGDGGQALGAEIGDEIGQIAFDRAGNMYFTDTQNNRVRRVDTVTGIIHTVAGNGATGRTGDGGPATTAAVGSPTGLAVDSEGQIYVLAQSATTGTAQVVRKVNTTGELSFDPQPTGSTAPVLVLDVANTGNYTLNVSKMAITGVNSADFTINPNATNCAAGIALNAGQSCKVGINFKPSAVGARSAVLVLGSNTVTGENVASLIGTGTTAAIVKFTSPSGGQAIASGTGVKLAARVTARTGPAPTGKVRFAVDGHSVGAGRIVSGVASVNAAALAPGSHALRAVYTGDAYHPRSNATESIIVSR